jgi:glutamine amidotransferase-like uncharacterized protein
MTQKSKIFALLVVLLIMPLIFVNPTKSSYIQPTDLGGIKVAVYVGVNDEQSSSLSSRTALFWMFRWMNATVDVVTAEEIRNNVLDDYDLVAIPGGWAWAYFQDLGSSGVAMIRQFVENGGAYFGVCAGAYFACDSIRWEGEYIQYSLDLYPNIGNGPIDEIASWPGNNMTRINLNKGATGPNLFDEPDHHIVMYYGGPYFETSGTEGVITLATYDVNDKPAMISYEYGQGRLVLSGPHVEWEEDSDRDGVAWDNVYSDEGSEWNMMLQIGLWLTEKSATDSITTTTSTSTAENHDAAMSPLDVGLTIALTGIIAIIALVAYKLKK